jgi:hypothetical protein
VDYLGSHVPSSEATGANSYVNIHKTVIPETLMDRRRSLIAAYYLTGLYTCEAVRDQLELHHSIKVSRRTVNKDLAYLRKQWVALAAKSTDAWIQTELAKLADLETQAIVHLRSVAVAGDPVKFSDYTKDYIELQLKISKRRANLLGLDKPRKIEHSGDLLGLSDAELEKIAGGKEEDAA